MHKDAFNHIPKFKLVLENFFGFSIKIMTFRSDNFKNLLRPTAYKLTCFDRNINGNRDVKFLIAIIGHCTDQRKLL